MDVWVFVSVEVPCDTALLSLFDVLVVCFKIEVRREKKKEETDSIFYSHLIRSLFMQ